MIRAFLLALVFTFCAATQAHAISENVGTLYSTAGVTATVNGSAFTVPTWAKACNARLHAVKNSGTTPTLDVKVQHSLDGTTWFDELTFTQVTTGTSDQIQHVNTASTRQLPFVRAALTLGGTTPNFDAAVYFDCER